MSLRYRGGLDSYLQVLDAERDVLAKERDALKAALSKASQRSGYSVLPYKGPNGTWRRPIVLECAAGGVKLQPKGLMFTSMDLSPIWVRGATGEFAADARGERAARKMRGTAGTSSLE